MAESTITAKGQTTVPADIGALVDAKPGTRLVCSAMPEGTLIVRAKSKSILDMAGMLRPDFDSSEAHEPGSGASRLRKCLI